MKAAISVILFACSIFYWGLPSKAVPPQAGSLEFVAQIRPASGISEPARGIPFVLLTKSYRDIQQEADRAEPEPDFKAFVEKLNVSPELKDWMTRNHSVSLSGEDFLRRLKPDDIIKVPEFFQAYTELHAGEKAIGFPDPKYRPKDEQKDPAKYEKLKQEYYDALRKYFTDNRQSADGMDLHLTDIDPSADWLRLQGKRVPEVHTHALDLAQSQYFVGRCETDVNGQAELVGVPAGTYWLSTLDVEAEVGDAHLRWDVPVTIRPGETTRVEVSNVNATQNQTHTALQ